MAGQPEDSGITHFRPERTHILAAAVIAMISLVGIGHAPLLLSWFLLIPILFVYWVLKAETRVSDAGVEIRYAFRGNRSFSWDQIKGVGFKRSRALLRDADGQDHALPGISFNSLPQLQAASAGRIPDALTAARAAAEDKVAIFNRDGEQVLISQEEYAERQAEKAQLEAAANSNSAPVPDTDTGNGEASPRS